MLKTLLTLAVIVLASLLLFATPRSTFASHLQFTWFSRPLPTPRPVLNNYTTPTSTLRPSSTATPKPTSTPTSTPRPTSTTTPRPSATQAPVTEDRKTYIINAINAYRSSQGLSSIATNNETCNFAKTRAQEITTAFNHDGFQRRVTDKTLPYPSYQLVTENIARTSRYQDVVNMWINSPGHAENMRKDTPYVCVESIGDYYAYEGWKP